jgi:SAM-dependent methyltransferase
LRSDVVMPLSRALQSAQAYWDSSAETYDQDFADTLVGRLRRQTIWSEADRVFRAGQRILELNCGTGIDAVHMAQRGLQVVACDISPRMIELSRRRVAVAGVEDRVSLHALPTESVDSLGDEGPFDGVFSNFSGLNCVADLSGVARKLAPLLKDGAPALFCMMGRFVPWEIVWFLLHGHPRRALLRLRGGAQRGPQSPSVAVLCPSAAEVERQFSPLFQLKRRRGIGIAVPPSYMEPWAQRFPRLTAALDRVDRGLCRLPVAQWIGDCMLLEFERSQEHEVHRASPATFA